MAVPEGGGVSVRVDYTAVDAARWAQDPHYRRAARRGGGRAGGLARMSDRTQCVLAVEALMSERSVSGAEG